VDLSIRLARLLEALEGRVSDRLEAACPTLGEVRDAPQLSQNLLSAVKELPQTGQSVPNVAPHSRQNRASWRLIWPHRGHCMPKSPWTVRTGLSVRKRQSTLSAYQRSVSTPGYHGGRADCSSGTALFQEVVSHITDVLRPRSNAGTLRIWRGQSMAASLRNRRRQPAWRVR